MDGLAIMSRNVARRKPRVLIVDAEALLAHTLAQYLAPDFDVVVAGTIREAICIVDREPVSAVLLDVCLPDGSGLSVARRLHKQGKGHAAVVLSGRPLDEVRDEARRYGLEDIQIFRKEEARPPWIRMALRRAVSRGGAVLPFVPVSPAPRDDPSAWDDAALFGWLARTLCHETPSLGPLHRILARFRLTGRSLVDVAAILQLDICEAERCDEELRGELGLRRFDHVLGKLAPRIDCGCSPVFSDSRSFAAWAVERLTASRPGWDAVGVEVLTLRLMGLSNRLVVAHLGRSRTTVSRHLAEVLGELEATSVFDCLRVLGLRLRESAVRRPRGV